MKETIFRIPMQFFGLEEEDESFEELFSDVLEDFNEEPLGEEGETMPTQELLKEGQGTAELQGAGPMDIQGAGKIEPQGAGGEQPKGDDLVTVNLDGTPTTMGMEELVLLAQRGKSMEKGGAPQKTLPQMEEAQTQETQLLEELAKQNGMTKEDFMRAMLLSQEEGEILKMVEGGMPQDAAREMFALRKEKMQREKVDYENKSREEKNKLFVELLREYPDVTELPAPVIERMNGGETPLSAYRAYENQQLKEKLSAFEKNASNLKAPSSLKNEGAPTETDEFLSGLFGND